MSGGFETCMHEGGRAAVEGRWEDAKRLLSEAVSLDPRSADAHRSLAAVLHMSNRLDEALASWRTALELEPGSATSHFNIGLIHMGRQEYAAAKAGFAEALKIKPGLADAAFNLGRIAYHEDDRPAARTYFEQAVAAQPRHGKAQASLVQVLTELGLEKEALDAGLRGVMALRNQGSETPKGLVDLLMHMGNASRRLGDLGGAAQWYGEAVAADPENSVAKHLLAAAEGRLSQEHAKDYTIKSFDTFARSFEDHLLNILNYRSPDVLAEHLHELRPHEAAFPAVLDLGCGTGLMGVTLAKYFKVSSLIGVDLSRNMLDQAKSKGLYHELIKGDLVPVMEERTEAFDLIVSADVFIYVGEISDVFAQARNRLKPGGLFAFTIEISAGADVELAPTGRYRHGKAYLNGLADTFGFKVLRVEDGILRKDARSDIHGSYFYMEKV